MVNGTVDGHGSRTAVGPVVDSVVLGVPDGVHGDDVAHRRSQVLEVRSGNLAAAHLVPVTVVHAVVRSGIGTGDIPSVEDESGLLERGHGYGFAVLHVDGCVLVFVGEPVLHGVFYRSPYDVERKELSPGTTISAVKAAPSPTALLGSDPHPA